MTKWVYQSVVPAGDPSRGVSLMPWASSGMWRFVTRIRLFISAVNTPTYLYVESNVQHVAFCCFEAILTGCLLLNKARPLGVYLINNYHVYLVYDLVFVWKEVWIGF